VRNTKGKKRVNRTKEKSRRVYPKGGGGGCQGVSTIGQGEKENMSQNKEKGKKKEKRTKETTRCNGSIPSEKKREKG